MARSVRLLRISLAAVLLAATAQAQSGTTPAALDFDWTFTGTLAAASGDSSETYLLLDGTGSLGVLGPASLSVVIDHATESAATIHFKLFNFGGGGARLDSALAQLPGQSADATRTVETLPTGVAVETISGSGEFTSGTAQFIDAYGPFSFTLAISAGAISQPITFTFNATGTLNLPNLRVAPDTVRLRADSSPVGFSLDLAGANPSAQTFTAKANSDGDWLSVTPPSGTIALYTGVTLAGTANPSGMNPGVYRGDVTVTTSLSTTSTVPVTMIIPAADQLVVSQTGVSLQALAGAAATGAQPVFVSSTGATALDFTTSASTLSGGNWLSVTPALGSGSSTAPVTVNISANPTGLAPGNYFGRVDFSAAAAGNSPQSVVVALTVLPASAATGPLFAPTGLVFVAPAGSNPAAQTIQISNPSAAAVTLTAQPDPGSTWMTLSSSGGSVASAAPLAETVSVNTAGLAPGAYWGSLELQAAASGNNYVLPILLVVEPAGGAACTPTQLLVMFSNLADGFAATAGFPVPINVDVLDDCGSPLTTGSVTASFGSGDASVSMVSTGGGEWAGAWMPHNASAGPASAAVTAHSPASAAMALTGSGVVSGTVAANTTIPMMNASSPAISAASFAVDQPLSPGTFISIFGSNLATTPTLVGAPPYPPTLAGTQVILGGKALPLQYVGGGQINAIVPWGAPAGAAQQLIVQQNGMSSMPQTVVTAAATPGVFTQTETGAGLGSIIVVKPDGTQFVVGASQPASAGDTLEIYCTGLGAVSPAVPDGEPASLVTLSWTVGTVTATIGGQPAHVSFAGLAPGYAGLYQVNATVPAGIAAAQDVPVVISEGNFSSPPVTIAVQ